MSCEMVLPTEEDVWDLCRAYFSKYTVVRHNIESYNYFMTVSLPHIVQESSEIKVKDATCEHVIMLCNVSVQKPICDESDGYDRPIMPHMARMRSATYSCAVMVDVMHDIHKAGELKERRVFREVLLCRIPCMVGSMYCHTFKSERQYECRLDNGGYFIINGIEKALLAQEKLHTNHPYIFPVRQPSKYQLVCEIRSCHELKMRSTSTLYLYMTTTKKGAIPEMAASLPFIDMDIPILALFKLMGVSTRDEALTYIIGDTEVDESRLLCGILDNDSTCDMNVNEILEWIGKEGTKEQTKEKRTKYLDHIITNEMLPHMGLTTEPDVLKKKASFLGYMVRKLIAVHNGQLQCDDRDHYANKRIDTAGVLMSLLFRQVFRGMTKSLATQLSKLQEQNKMEYTNIGDLINDKKVTAAFKYAFSTGNWGMQRGSPGQTGVAQMMSRMTPVASSSNLRRINTPINREGKAPKPRQLHYTSWGVVCPVETPEGASCGLVKNLAMMTHVRIGTHSGALKEQLDIIGNGLVYILNCTDKIRTEGTPVFINGVLYAYASTLYWARELVENVRKLRRTQMLPFDTSVAFVDDSICIDSDPGCLLRPLIVADRIHEIHNLIKNAPSFENMWDSFIASGIIEYIDKQEEIDLKVGMYMREDCIRSDYTHYELHPSHINGLCASLIVYPDHNQAPRNCYQSAMGKQAVSLYALNYPRRLDAVSHVLMNGQKPIVTTRMDDILHTSEAPTGCTAIVCIMCYSGFNQEDSLIVNQSALDRGLFRSMKFQTYKDEEHSNGADAEKFQNPISDKCVGMRVGCYDKLDENGFVPIGTAVEAGDVIIGKAIITNEIGEGAKRALKRDRSVIVRQSDDSVVDAIMKSKKRDGSYLAKVRTRSTKTPMVGDKLCYDEHTHILTERGWIPAPMVRSNDNALVYDPITKHMAYEPIENVHHYPPEEQCMYELQTSNLDLKVTMNHNMYVSNSPEGEYELEPAKDIIGKQRTYLNTCKNGLSPCQIQPPPVPKKLLTLFGLWIGYGCIDHKNIKIAHVKQSTRDAIIDVIEALKLKYESEHDTITVFDNESLYFMKSYAHTFLPNWCFKLSIDHSRHLIEGMLMNSMNSCVYYTTSLQLKDDLQKLVLHAGWSSCSEQRTENGGRGFSGGRVWRIAITKRPRKPKVNDNNSTTYERIAKYHGSVHCISVRTGIIHVRRNGKTAWCGNSSRHGQKGVVSSRIRFPFLPSGVSRFFPH